MRRILLLACTTIFLINPTFVRGEELPLICQLKEDLNFKNPAQTIYLRVDMEKHTVNGIPATVLGGDIISYETKSESLTFILPSMYLRLIRKSRGQDGADISYTGSCREDKLDF